LDDDADKSHPLFDPRVDWPVEESFLRSIATLGVKAPVVVVRDGDRLLVSDGRQRVKAARILAEQAEQAGEPVLRVPYVEVIADRKRSALISVSLNEHRKDDSVLDRALKSVRFMDIVGDTEEVAQAFGRTPTTIKNWAFLAAAEPCIHEAVRAKKISASAAIDISRLPSDEQQEALDSYLKAQKQLSSKSSKSKNEGESTKKDTSGQTGVKRSWLRKALKTKYAESLDEDQLKVLKWFAFGESAEEDWFDLFTLEVNIELGS
jgi:ParB family chromosome partitioning protein